MTEKGSLFFRYFKAAWSRSKIVNTFMVLLPTAITVFAFLKGEYTFFEKILVCLIVLFALFCWFFFQLALAALSDVVAPRIRRAFDKSAFRDQFDILFLTERSLYSTMFDIGTYVSLVMKSGEVENTIGYGIIVNKQSNGVLQVGINLFDTFKDCKSEIEKNTDNIYFIPYKNVGGLYER